MFIYVCIAGVILCCSGLYSLTLGLSMSIVFPDKAPDYVQWCMIASLGFQYLVFALIFILDAITGQYNKYHKNAHFNDLNTFYSEADTTED